MDKREEPAVAGGDVDGELVALHRHELGREIAIVARRWRVRMNERLRAESMSSPRWSVLYWLSQSPGGVSQTELAERAGVEPATLVRTLDNLERDGLAERRAYAHDRRVKLVFITKDAWPLLERMKTIGDEVRAELLGDAPPDEVQAALRLLRRLRSSLDNGQPAPARAARKRALSDYIA